MESITLHNGIQMPLVGFGTWDLRGDDCIKAVSSALKIGYRLIDTAKMYGNEKEVGKGIRNSGIPREDIFLTTKIEYNVSTYKAAERSIKDSLIQLDTEYIDLILIHKPSCTAPQMYAALEDAYSAGLVRSIGISNCNEMWYSRFLEQCRIVPMVDQVETHLHFQKHKLQKVLKDHGTAMQAWSPLGGPGMTAGILSERVLQQIASEHGVTPAQTALRLMVQRGISVIPKSSHEQRQRENFDLFGFLCPKRKCRHYLHSIMIEHSIRGRRHFNEGRTICHGIQGRTGQAQSNAPRRL